MIRGMLLAMALVGLTFVATAQDKDKPETQLLGKWKLVKSGDPLPPGLEASIEFGKEGKLKLNIKFGDKAESIEGMWKVKEKKIELTMKQDGKEKTETIEIVKLNEKDLHTKDDKGKIDEFEKIKEDKK